MPLTTDDRILLAQISDLHIGAGVGHADPARRVERVVAALADLDPAPDAVVVSGDLAQDGEPAQYARVRELLAPLPMPVYSLPGNHDVRSALKDAVLAGMRTGPGDFLQYETTAGRLRLLVCDTIDARQDGGRLCAERMGWLGAALAADRETPTVVAMHHPPLLTGIARDGRDRARDPTPWRSSPPSCGRAPNVHARRSPGTCTGRCTRRAAAARSSAARARTSRSGSTCARMPSSGYLTSRRPSRSTWSRTGRS